MTIKDINQEKNKEHYEKLYATHSIKNTLYWLNNIDSFFDAATATEASWFALYQGNFRERLRGKKVLEMGCGDCNNAAIMAMFGAEVYANDIASSSGNIVRQLNENYKFEFPIKFVEGDFLFNKLPSGSFDYVIGKAFLHHLTIPVEKLFLKETTRLLKPNGEARFYEPAVNSVILDEIRWHIPMGKRPSKFNKEAFREWKEKDPHPIRSFSSSHFEQAGIKLFQEVKVMPIGALERFSKIWKWGEKQNRFKRWALKKESFLPNFLSRPFSRSQLIIYKNPRN